MTHQEVHRTEPEIGLSMARSIRKSIIHQLIICFCISQASLSSVKKYKNWLTTLSSQPLNHAEESINNSMKISELSRKNINLSEIKMSPGAIKSRVSRLSGITVGIEFELVVKDFDEEAKPRKLTPDYDYDEYVNDSSWENLRSDIRDFFKGDYNTIRNILNEIDNAHGEYRDWKSDLWDTYVAENYDDWHREYTDDDSDIDEQPYANLFKKEKYEDFEESQGNIKNWLDDRNLVMMSNWAKRYDLTWPHWLEPENTHMRGYDEITDSFKNAIGMDVEYATEYHRGERSSNAYMIEPDSSIKPEKSNNEDFGLEFISPPLPLADAIDHIYKVKHWAQEGNAYTNSTTGLHMNVSLPGYSAESLDYIKLVLFLGDSWLLEQFKRSSNEYARSSIDYINQRVTDNIELLPQALAKMRQGFNNLASKLIHQGYSQKTLSVSVLENRVEFRAPGDDWLKMNIDDVVNTLYRCVDALDLALKPEREKREYSAKLYKVLSPANPDAIKLFVDYQKGEISRSDLKKAWAEQVLGFRGDVKTQLSGTKDIARRILRSDLRNYPIVKLPEGEIVADVTAIDFNTALKQAFKTVQDMGIKDLSWYLYEPANPNKGRYYNIIDSGGKFKHNLYSTDPQELYNEFSKRANQYGVKSWYMIPDKG